MDEPQPHPVAAMILRSPQGRVLMMRRVDGEGWAFPAGGIKDGEEPEEGAIRELREETGYHLPAPGQMLMRRVKDGVDCTTYVTDVDHEFSPTLNYEHDAYGWFDPAQVVDECRADAGRFEEGKHPRAKGGEKGGQFVKKGQEGAATQKTQGAPKYGVPTPTRGPGGNWKHVPGKHTGIAPPKSAEYEYAPMINRGGQWVLPNGKPIEGVRDSARLERRLLRHQFRRETSGARARGQRQAAAGLFARSHRRARRAEVLEGRAAGQGCARDRQGE